jgi:hypothetical protein
MIRIRFMFVGAGTVMLALAGCGETRMALDGDMTFDGSLRLEGPVQMQLSGPSVTYSGTYVSEALFERVRPNETREDWILAVLGEPDVRSRLADGSEIWRWSYQPVAQQGAAIAMWTIGGEDEPMVKQSTTFLHMRDGVVIESWRD